MPLSCKVLNTDNLSVYVPEHQINLSIRYYFFDSSNYVIVKALAPRSYQKTHLCSMMMMTCAYDNVRRNDPIVDTNWEIEKKY